MILGIMSSPSQRGNTAILVQSAIIEAEKHGAKTRTLFLPELHIEFCKGCFHCTREGWCIIDDDMRRISNDSGLSRADRKSKGFRGKDRQ